MARILILNPNCSTACTAGIDAAIAAFRHPGGPALDVVGFPQGPPAIYSWRDWHGVVEALCRRIEAESADVFVIACASDPGIEAARTVTDRPVLGVFRSAVAMAVARAERFGVIAIVEASKARHRSALRAMGLEGRLAGEFALNVSMDTLLDGAGTRSRLIQAARRCVEAGAETVILGCTGMAHHRAAVEAACGAPVIEPCQAAASLAVGLVLAGVSAPSGVEV